MLILRMTPIVQNGLCSKAIYYTFSGSTINYYTVAELPQAQLMHLVWLSLVVSKNTVEKATK